MDATAPIETDVAPAQETTEEVSVPMATIRSGPDARPCNVLVHDGEHKMYVPVFPRALSLESCEGDSSAASIEFVHDTAIHVGGAVETRLQSSGDFLQTPPIPLYHAHVLWSYTLRITRLKDEKCALSLVSMGPHLGIDSSEKKGSLGRNEPSNHGMPRVLAASLVILQGEQNEEGERMELSSDRGGSLSSNRQFTIEELPTLAGGDVLRVRVRLVVGRSYFALSKMVNLTAVLGSGNAEGILRLIVRGEKPPGSDWAITVAESDGPSLFHVHRAAFGSMSDSFKVAFQTGHSYDDQILMVTGESRCIIPAFTAHDMKVVIPLVYGLYAPLPEDWQRVSALGRTLCRLFKPDLITGFVFPQWQRAIVEQALALDKKEFSSFTEIFRLLTIVWSCPYGSMPVAKRVAVGVMADMVHLRGDEGTAKLLSETVIPSLGELGKTVHVGSIICSVSNHLTMVSSVRKTGLAARDAEWK